MSKPNLTKKAQEAKKIKEDRALDRLIKDLKKK